MNKINNYVDEVLSYIIADNKMKRRIRDDLTSQLNEAARTQDLDDVILNTGDPKDVAREFMDTIYEDKSELFDEIMSKHSDEAMLMKRVYEYKSKTSVFGIPLVHIKLNRYGRPTVAKGILAIGTFSIGVVSIGAFPVGLLSFGGIAAGLIAFGGLSLGLLLAIGGLAVGALAFGGFAVGLCAIGGFSIGDIAIGGLARGTVAIGDDVAGKHILSTHNLGPETPKQVAALIRTAYPNVPDWIIDFITGISLNFNQR